MASLFIYSKERWNFRKKLINLIQSVTTSDIVSIIKDERAYLYNSFISFGIVLVCVIVIIIYTVLRSKLKKKKNQQDKIPRN